MTDLWAYFGNGDEYDKDGGTVDTPRKKCCKSCAFSKNPATVRPPEVSIAELEAHTRDFDIFYCHSQMQDGKFHICAKWFKEFGDNVARSQKELTEMIEAMT